MQKAIAKKNGLSVAADLLEQPLGLNHNPISEAASETYPEGLSARGIGRERLNRNQSGCLTRGLKNSKPIAAAILSRRRL